MLLRTFRMAEPDLLSVFRSGAVLLLVVLGCMRLSCFSGAG